MHLVVFEGSRWQSFAPLALSRPVFSLHCGLTSLLEKQIRHIQPDRLTLWVRPAFEEYCRRLAPTLGVPTQVNVPLDDEPALIFSGRSLHLSRFKMPEEFCAVVDEGDVVRKAYVKSPGLGPRDVLERTEAWLRLLDLPRDPEQARLPESIWDLVHWNEEAIVSDAAHRKDRPPPLSAGPWHVISAADVMVSPEAKIAPGVVFDASKGPVVVEAHATIGAYAVLQGPCAVGRHAQVSPHSHIHGGTSIGTMCKIGGEVSSSIFLGYSNKAHYGFVGHSYVGQWVNLGADTTTSNLKNTYGPVRVRIADRVIETHRRFLGSVIGDHTKTAIGTRLMSGSYLGFCSMLSLSRIPPTFIPSFAFWTDEGSQPYRLEKARQVISRVYSRRNKHWSEEDEELLEYVHEVSRAVES